MLAVLLSAAQINPTAPYGAGYGDAGGLDDDGEKRAAKRRKKGALFVAMVTLEDEADEEYQALIHPGRGHPRFGIRADIVKLNPTNTTSSPGKATLDYLVTNTKCFKYLSTVV